MKKSKRILSFILATLMCCSVLTVFASAKSDLPFDDVRETAWYYDSVRFVYEKGVMVGTSATAFSPNMPLSRAMLVTLLWRLGGSVEAGWTGAFSDVPAGKWYTSAIEWARIVGLGTGYGNGKFGPDDMISREQTVTFIFRAAKLSGYDTSSRKELDEYTDADDVASWALDAAKWACSLNIVSGKGNGILDPKGTTNRAEAATLIKRYIEYINNPSGEMCTVVFDTDGGSNVEKQTVTKGSLIKIPESPEKGGFVFVGWYVDKQYSDIFDFSKPISKSTTVYARWVNTDDKTDTDGDGLTDAFEEYYNTNPNKQDTDGDGLSDYIEIAFLNLDALKEDTDGNGIPDGKEDSDGDGIDNITETEIGTNPSLTDTDNDGLEDKPEIDVYNTDPINEDTDGDGVSDGKEVELGTDPKVAQSSFNINMSADENANVVPSVKIQLSGDQVETLSIEAVNDDNLFPETMPGYMGKAYDFNVNGEFNEATISFEFDSAEFSNGIDPVICYYDENNQELEELDTIINGNVASAKVKHFSKYILIDRKLYYDSFTWTDVWDSSANYTGVEIILVIDDSGSMSWNDSGNQRLAVAKNLIDQLPKNSKIGIVKFTSSTTKLTNQITEDKEAAKAYLSTSNFKASGGTRMYNAINNSFSMFESSDSSIMKTMVVLSDGESDDLSMHNSIVSAANTYGVKVYTVGLGNSTNYFTNYLKPLAINTGGAFYLASNADQLSDIYKNISEKIDIETDTDGDGIPDYYEDNMICFNGVKFALDKNNKDTDGDNIEDGEEFELKYEYNSDRTKVKVTGKYVKGNPVKIDTDGDGYTDGIDEDVFNWNISDRDLVLCASMSYSRIPLTGSLSKLSNRLIDEINGRFNNAASIDELGKRWSVVDTWYANGGLQALAFKVDNNIVVAYRGTDEFFKDWFNNITTYVLGISTQSGGAKKFIKTVMSNYSRCNIYVTGHSLGGHLVYNAAAEGINYNKSAIKGVVTFNGLGLTVGITLFNDVWDEHQLQKKLEVIRNYSVEGDPVSQGFLGTTTCHYGKLFLYEKNPNARDSHDLYTFIAALGPKARNNGN